MDWMVESFIDSCPGAKVGWFWNLLMRSFKLCFASPGNLYFIEAFRVCLHTACTSTPVYTCMDLFIPVNFEGPL